MRRRLMSVAAAALVVPVVVTAVAVARASDDQRVGPLPGYRMHGMMSPSSDGLDWSPDRRWWRGPSASSEFAYLAEMVAHHEEAVAAAEELRRSKRLRAFGDSIIASQSAQIDKMNGWLAQWYPGRSSDTEYRPMMRDLSGLSGEGLDEAFLTDMISHHMAAVMMSQRLLVDGLAKHTGVDALAASIRDEQHAEIHQMRRWLADWFGIGWQHRPGRHMGRGMMMW